MTVLVVTFLVPTFWMISSSLKVSTEVFAHPIVWLPQDPHWNNYVKAFQLLPLTRFIYNTLIIVLFAVVGTVVSSALVAYSFARISWPGRNFWFAPAAGDDDAARCGDPGTPFPDIQKPEMDRHVAAADRSLLGGHRRNLRLSHAPVLSRHPDGAGRRGRDRRRQPHPRIGADTASSLQAGE